MNAEKIEMLVTVKTYPALSSRHNEVVCTAGVKSDGSWIRIYPICYRSLPQAQKFKKYQWISFEAQRDLRDPRFESYKLVSSINPSNIMTTYKQWTQRKSFVLKDIQYVLNDIIDTAYDKTKYQSLVVFKPQRIKKFIVRNVDSTKEINKKREILMHRLNEGDSLAEDLPYRFFYTFIDFAGKDSTLQIIDWEIYQLTRKLIKRYGGNTDKISQILTEKYFDEIAVNRDVHLFLGTNKYWHIRRSKNPFMIVGIFYPPKS